jgi:hypothetical protein
MVIRMGIRREIRINGCFQHREKNGSEVTGKGEGEEALYESSFCPQVRPRHLPVTVTHFATPFLTCG